jgi:hypothetical protein
MRKEKKRKEKYSVHIYMTGKKEKKMRNICSHM